MRAAEQLAGVESFYTAGHMEWPHLIDNSLKAHHLYKRDVNYVVNGDEVVIVDEFTGRLMPGRNWSDGLHQAVEAKEGVRIKEENQTLATITLQNFFKLYDKICGMTGTAMTEAAEFWKIYKLDVIAVPTNKPLRRLNNPDVIYRTEHEKYNAIADEIERMHKWDVLVNDKGEEYLGKIIHETDETVEFQPRGGKDRETIAKSKIKEIERRGRPMLVGTVSIERSELISGLLEKRGIPHQVLNAKHHQREAEIVAQAGRLGAVTIATNMAGRGTDIILGGNPEAMAWAQAPGKISHPAGSAAGRMGRPGPRNRAARADEGRGPRRGRHGRTAHPRHRTARSPPHRPPAPRPLRPARRSRQQPLLPLAGRRPDADLRRRVGQEHPHPAGHEGRRGHRKPHGFAPHRGRQKKVEERNFEVRKNLLEYDEVMDEQRKRVYGYRQNILNGANCKQLILEMIDQQIDHYLDQFLDKDYGTETFAGWAAKQLAVEFEPRDFRGMDFAVGRDRRPAIRPNAWRKARCSRRSEENLPEEEEPSEWNWEALAKMVNTRWHLSLRDRDLKQLGRDQVGDFLIERARAAVAEDRLQRGRAVPAAGVRRADRLRLGAAQVRHRAGAGRSPRVWNCRRSSSWCREKAQAAYEEKEMAYPVMAGLYHFTTRDATGHKHYEREELGPMGGRAVPASN